MLLTYTSSYASIATMSTFSEVALLATSSDPAAQAIVREFIRGEIEALRLMREGLVRAVAMVLEDEDEEGIKRRVKEMVEGGGIEAEDVD